MEPHRRASKDATGPSPATSSRKPSSRQRSRSTSSARGSERAAREVRDTLPVVTPPARGSAAAPPRAAAAVPPRALASHREFPPPRTPVSGPRAAGSYIPTATRTATGLPLAPPPPPSTTMPPPSITIPALTADTQNPAALETPQPLDLALRPTGSPKTDLEADYIIVHRLVKANLISGDLAQAAAMSLNDRQRRLDEAGIQMPTDEEMREACTFAALTPLPMAPPATLKRQRSQIAERPSR